MNNGISLLHHPIRPVAYGVHVYTRARGFEPDGSDGSRYVPQYVLQPGVHPVYFGETLEEIRVRFGRQYGVPPGDVRVEKWGA